ncbi:MAG: hypothetical protein AAGJ08_03140 [Cyanobacteria bacterium P01_H01_bin.35]
MSGADLTGANVNQTELSEACSHLGVSHKWVTWAGTH